MSSVHNATRTEELFERVLALAAPLRGAFLDRECAGDAALRARMTRLLEFAESDAGFLERSPVRVAGGGRVDDSVHRAGHLIGAYRLLRPIGAGGSAEVWLAERTEGGFAQNAAVKIVRDARGASRDRFELECGILASLSHPGIARLHDGGVERNGYAYMVMEYVEGEHLVAYAQARALSLQDRLGLFAQVCDAVAYAHTRLVVHRDIKPANILVTPAGQVKLLDFGIARLLDADAAPHVTRTVQLSPAYAAPEQLTGDYVSTATDVYALGVTLFELLTDRLPWAGEGASLATAVKRLVDRPAALPSRAAVAGSPVSGRALRGDLDAIVARALRREPGARYADARMLGDDIRRHLDHEPVLARVGVRAYVLSRFVRRNWPALAIAASVFVAMAIALFAIAWQSQKVRIEAQRTAAVQAFMVDLFRTNSGRQADPVKARQTTARELLDIGARRIETSLDDAPESKLALLRLFGDLYREVALTTEQMSVGRQAIDLSRRLYGEDSPELAGDLISLANVVTDRAQYEDLLGEARAILDRRRDTTSLLRGRLLAALAGHHYTYDIPRALDEAGAAVSIFDRFNQPVELAHALYLQGMADSYRGNVAPALASLHRAVEVSTAVEGSPDSMLSTYYKQLGETQSTALDYAGAEASMRHAIDLARSDTAEFNYDLVRAQAALSEILVNADRPADGLPIALKADAEAPPAADEKHGDPQLKRYTLNTLSRAQLRAGELDAALANARAGKELARQFDPEGTAFIASLQAEAGVLVELGRTSEAVQALDEAGTLLTRAGQAYSEFIAVQRIRIALDERRLDDARQLLEALPPPKAGSPAATVVTGKRNVLRAELALADGDAGEATRLAGAVLEGAHSDPSVSYLRSMVSDAQVIEGLARVRSGHGNDACPTLGAALATRIALYLPSSARIAQAQLALAECTLALGGRSEAAALVASAKAIESRHSSLSRRYVEPLQTLVAELAR